MLHGLWSPGSGLLLWQEAAVALPEPLGAVLAASKFRHRAQVLISAPVGLCFLPAFLAVGVAPVVIGLATGLMDLSPLLIGDGNTCGVLRLMEETRESPGFNISGA